jgi:hypothetical protein
LFHNAAAQQRKCALGNGFTYGSRYGCAYGRLGLRVTAGSCSGVLQEAHQQLLLLRAQDSFIPHQRFRKGIENLLRRHRAHSSLNLVERF